MVVKTNIYKRFKIIETKYEYINALSKHFSVGKNPFLLVYVLICHFSSMSSLPHFTLIEITH